VFEFWWNKPVNRSTGSKASLRRKKENESKSRPPEKYQKLRIPFGYSLDNNELYFFEVLD